MAGLTIHNTYIVTFSKAISTLAIILQKAEAHAKENGKAVDADYAGARLIEDMLPLTFQIHQATNAAKAAIRALTGTGAETWANDLKTFADLHARIKATQELLDAVKPEQVNGREDEVLKL